MKIPQHNRIKLALGIIILGFGIWVLTPILSVHAHRITGYEYLQQALEVLGDQNPAPDYCVSGGISDPKALEMVKKAVQVLEEGRELKSRDSQTLLFLGRGYCLLGRVDKAVEVYEKYTQQRPENPLGHLELGFGYEASGSLESAIAEWKKGGLNANQFVNKGLEAQKLKNYSRAQSWYVFAIHIEPNNGVGYYHLGSLFETLEEWEQAREFLEISVEKSPNNANSWLHYGLVSEHFQEWAEALEIYEQAITQGELSGVSYLYFRIGYIKQYSLNPRDINGALDAYANALEKDHFQNPQQKGNTHYQRGLLFTWQKQWEQAIEEFELGITLGANKFWSYYFIGRAYWNKGETQQAIDYATKSLELAPDQKEPYFLLGEIYESIGSFQDAIDVYTRLLELNQKDQEILDKLEHLKSVNQ